MMEKKESMKVFHKNITAVESDSFISFQHKQYTGIYFNGHWLVKFNSKAQGSFEL